jgi:hypothetical protein
MKNICQIETESLGMDQALPASTNGLLQAQKDLFNGHQQAAKVLHTT